MCNFHETEPVPLTKHTDETYDHVHYFLAHDFDIKMFCHQIFMETEKNKTRADSTKIT